MHLRRSRFVHVISCIMTNFDQGPNSYCTLIWKTRHFGLDACLRDTHTIHTSILLLPTVLFLVPEVFSKDEELLQTAKQLCYLLLSDGVSKTLNFRVWIFHGVWQSLEVDDVFGAQRRSQCTNLLTLTVLETTIVFDIMTRPYAS